MHRLGAPLAIFRASSGAGVYYGTGIEIVPLIMASKLIGQIPKALAIIASGKLQCLRYARNVTVVYYLVFKNIEIYLPFHLIGFHITANRPRPKQNMSQRIRGTKIYLSVIRTSESDYYCIVRQQPRHFATTKNRLYLHNQKRKQWIKTRYYPA